jgi:hypothetical protein
MVFRSITTIWRLTHAYTRQFDGSLWGVGLETRKRVKIPEKGKQAWGKVDLDNEKSQFCSCWHEAENVPIRG